ncbi:WbqC family protein [Clostridium thermobutyricum]|uniref:WbqC-like protein family protein n=1 Tax=Clostridium thermobutyricum DSM 4928 TaxID=1121339 RepID=A0A1V4SYX6_9CLOT|nr:WbqC family protein [Clostridium thermobutyricum]OPX50370.1 WbqC-like protein family protein [Clostridium thermobutyricum DSM 4928]
MKVGIMQPYFLPYIGYWQLLNAVDKYVIYDDVNFIKKGWINRNRILMNGQATLFNIQMKGASQNKKINEIEISKENVWRNKLLKSIELSYKKAPFYEVIFPIIKTIINFETKNLAKYIENSIRVICEYLDINTKLIISSDLKKDNILKGEDKIINICKILGANEYYNAIGGRELYNYDTFKKNDIKLKFLKTENFMYKQFGDSYIEGLSILDVIMFNSKEEVKAMLNKYSLI